MTQAIYVLDPEPSVRAAIRDVLAPEPDTEVRVCARLAELDAQLDPTTPTLLVWSIPGASPDPDALRWLEAPPRPWLGVIVLVHGDDEAAIDAILTAGAHDVLTKPLRAATLLTRVRRLWREVAVADADRLSLGPYSFDVEQRVLHDPVTDRRVRLTEKEAAILLHLHQAAGPVERTTLLHEVWGYNDQITTHTLETHIYKLRQKIEANPSDARLLLTEGGGYRLARL